jgi:hypothetical protein
VAQRDGLAALKRADLLGEVGEEVAEGELVGVAQVGVVLDVVERGGGAGQVGGQALAQAVQALAVLVEDDAGHHLRARAVRRRQPVAVVQQRQHLAVGGHHRRQLRGRGRGGRCGGGGRGGRLTAGRQHRRQQHRAREDDAPVPAAASH